MLPLKISANSTKLLYFKHFDSRNIQENFDQPIQVHISDV